MANTDLKRFAQVAVSLQKAFNHNSQDGILDGGGSPLGSEVTPPKAVDISTFDVVPQKNRQFFAISAQIAAIAQAAGVQDQIDVELSYEGMIVTLNEALLFDSASADLTPAARETLLKVSNILRPLANPLRVQAHTDDLPSNTALFPTNWELSSARATAIVRFLAEKANIAPERLSADAFGQYRPRVVNDTRTHRAMNRRAEIVILYTEVGSLSDPAPIATPSAATAPDTTEKGPK
jgi:chemotaxis protein MotB